MAEPRALGIWVERCQKEYFEDTIATIKVAARRAGVGVTDAAVNSLAYQTYQEESGGTGKLSFHEYLRFVDMGVGRGHKLGGLASMKVELQSRKQSGHAQVKDKGRPPKKIYSKIAYGKLSSLQGKLLNGFTDIVKEDIINELKQS